MLNRKAGAGAEANEPRDAADYVAAITRDLVDLCRKNRLTTLAYLLDMARLEAETTARAGADDAPSRRSGPAL